MNGRDDKGRFVNGHEAIITEPKPGEKRGRPKSMKTQVTEALQQAEDAMPEIIRQMIVTACDPQHKDTQKAKEYLIDRVYGKPKAELVAAIDANLSVSADTIAVAAQEALRLFKESIGGNDVQGQSEAEGSSEVKEAEAES